MIPSRHRRRVLLRRVQSASNSACSRRQGWGRRHGWKYFQVCSHRHRGCGGDGSGRMEFVRPFHLLGTNKTVRTGSNQIDRLRRLLSDSCLGKGGGVDSEDRSTGCNVGSVVWVSVSLFRERPSREKRFRNRILRGLRRETRQDGPQLLSPLQRSAGATCVLRLFRSSPQSTQSIQTCVMGHNTNNYPLNNLRIQRQRLHLARTASGWPSWQINSSGEYLC